MLFEAVGTYCLRRMTAKGRAGMGGGALRDVMWRNTDWNSACRWDKHSQQHAVMGTGSESDNGGKTVRHRRKTCHLAVLRVMFPPGSQELAKHTESTCYMPVPFCPCNSLEAHHLVQGMR